MTPVRLDSGTVHLRDGDTTACGLPASYAIEAHERGKTGRCARCLRVASIRGTLTDAWLSKKPVNRMALLRELADLRSK
jgi:hypothetical protein